MAWHPAGGGGAQLALKKEADVRFSGRGAKERQHKPEGWLAATDNQVSLVPEVDKCYTFQSSYLTATESLLERRELPAMVNSRAFCTSQYQYLQQAFYVFFQHSWRNFISAWLGISKALAQSLQLSLKHGLSKQQETWAPSILLLLPPVITRPGGQGKEKWSRRSFDAMVCWPLHSLQTPKFQIHLP